MRMVWVLAACVFFAGSVPAQDTAAQTDSVASMLTPYRAAAVEKWEAEIQLLEQLDASEPDPADGILLLGSSSIRMWKNAAVDLAPYRTIRRGYGGARYSDLAIYAERLIQPHKYRAVVVFVGNDITGSKNDHTPEQVERLVRYIVSVSQTHQSDAAVLIVEVTPTWKRIEAWPKIRELNARLREITQTLPNTYFVATADHYLDMNNEPRRHLFGDDDLHQSEAGYSVWSALIRRRLDEVFRMLAEEQARLRVPAKPAAETSN